MFLMALFIMILLNPWIWVVLIILVIIFFIIK
jgi:hypothetical protein